MAKLSSVLKNEKKEYWVNKYRLKRKELRATIKNPHLTEDERELARQKLNKLPRLSLETRVKHRCKVTGRPRGYLRKFQMSRLSFRELANRGLIPGVTKASW